MTKLNLSELDKRLTLLEAQQQWVYRVLETYGIKGLWLSPGKASALLGISRDRILAEVERAEKMRSLGKRGDDAFTRQSHRTEAIAMLCEESSSGTMRL